jgi:hypothetical protein
LTIIVLRAMASGDQGNGCGYSERSTRTVFISVGVFVTVNDSVPDPLLTG